MSRTGDMPFEGLDSVLGKPGSFFDIGYLRDLGIFLFEDVMHDCFNEPSHVLNIVNLIKAINQTGQDPRSIKTLDFGAGHGYIMAAFAMHGCPVYGIEKNPHLVSATKKNYTKLRLDRPQLIHGDYTNRKTLETMFFPDDTRFQDIDFFYCHAYSNTHAEDILVKSLAPFFGAKVGSHAFLDAKINPYLLEEVGFETVPVENVRYGQCIKKVIQE